MREILFRGKRLDNGEWVYGDLENCKIRQKSFIHTYTDDGKYHCQFEVDPNTVGQYTGLTDKDGNKIFDGDILRFPPKERIEENNYVSYEVFWHDNDCADRHIGWQMNRYHYHGNVCGTISDFTTCLPKYTNKMIIVGNVHDPDLLKGGTK